MQSRWIKKGKTLGPFGPLALTSILIFLIVIAVVSSAGVWYQMSLKAKGGGVEKVFVVRKGESSQEIAERLEEDGLIKNATVFRIYLLSANIDADIEAGSFKLNSNQTVVEIANELQQGQLDRWITLVEGLRIEEIATELSEKFDIDSKKFINFAEEGYAFPDTYLIPVDASEERVVSILRSNFDEKVDEQILKKAKKKGLSKKQLIILASIVERESRNSEERPIIAGILIKRLREEIPLAVDATIQYALGYQKSEKTWWKKELTIQDLDIDSPYNSRKKKGFPPTPICNPGLSAIKAAASPTKTDYYFYIHDAKGNAHYATTIDEHNSNITKYIN